MDPQEEHRSEPIVCRGISSWLAVGIVCLAFFVGFIAPWIAIGWWVNSSRLPSVLTPIVQSLAGIHPALVVMTFLFSGFVVAFLVAKWIEPRSGRIVIGERGLSGLSFFTTASGEVPWPHVSGFDDGSSVYVAIVCRVGGLVESRICIPTPRDDDRRALLELLAKRGVPRV